MQTKTPTVHEQEFLRTANEVAGRCFALLARVEKETPASMELDVLRTIALFEQCTKLHGYCQRTIVIDNRNRPKAESSLVSAGGDGGDGDGGDGDGGGGDGDDDVPPLAFDSDEEGAHGAAEGGGGGFIAGWRRRLLGK